MSAHDRRFDDLPAVYLLGALPEDEAREFVAHVRDCAVCQHELRALKPAVDALPAGVEQHDPPRALQDRIMATVRSEAELLHASGPAADRATPEPARSRAAGRGRLAGWLGRPAFALAGVLVALALGGLGGVVLSGDGSDSGARIAAVRTLRATDAPDGARVSLQVRQGASHATLQATGLPKPGRGRVYQVWLRKGTRTPQRTNALFRPTAAGAATVDVPSGLRDVDDVLVTSEPDGGSPVPTRNPVIAVPTA